MAQKIWTLGSGNGRLILPLVLGLLLLFIVMRVAGVHGPAHLRWLLPLGFVLMALSPWLLLSREGRRAIGFRLPASAWSLLWAPVLGAAAALACFGLGMGLYDASPGNWFVTIAAHYRESVDTSGLTLWQLHLIFSIPAMLFSPIGEEIFFRGVLQRALEERAGVVWGTILQCSAFGLVHLTHHGVYYTHSGLSVSLWSALLWVLLMFAVALMFTWIRQKSGSLLPAIVSHSIFNLTMNIAIFSALWNFG